MRFLFFASFIVFLASSACVNSVKSVKFNDDQPKMLDILSSVVESRHVYQCMSGEFRNFELFWVNGGPHARYGIVRCDLASAKEKDFRIKFRKVGNTQDSLDFEIEYFYDAFGADVELSGTIGSEEFTFPLNFKKYNQEVAEYLKVPVKKWYSEKLEILDSGSHRFTLTELEQNDSGTRRSTLTEQELEDNGDKKERELVITFNPKLNRMESLKLYGIRGYKSTSEYYRILDCQETKKVKERY